MCSRRLNFHTANHLGPISASRDKIYINQLKLQTITGPDLWNALNTQKCHVSLRIGTDFSKSSTTDDLKYSLNYAVISRDITNLVKGRKDWLQLSNLTKSIYDFTTSKDRYRGVNELEVCVKNLDYHLRTPHISCIMREPTEEIYEIHNLELFTIIGVFTFERLQKQKVSLDIIIKSPPGLDKTSSLKLIIDNIVEYVEKSNFKTVEALVESVGKVISQSISSSDRDRIEITVKVIKLSAITDTDGVGVSTTKSVKQLDLLKSIKLKDNSMDKSTKFDLPVEQKFKQISIVNNEWNTAYLAFGSNIGNRVKYILSAINLLDKNPKIKVLNTSSLFESEPMYFKDQNSFMNGCLQIKTQLNPDELLTVCKQIEYEELKRVKHFDNGPRCIDLDIILYLNSEGNHVLVNTENLIVPHPKMLERTFVLEPLSELIPSTMLHPITSEPIIQHLDQIYAKLNDADYLTKLIPLPSINNSYRFLRFNTRYELNPISSQVIRKTSSPTYIMGIINNTPDSFSDGGKHFNNIDKKLDDIIRMCNEAFKLQENIIIDIGGCSTRPNSKQATSEEELSRSIQLIKTIRQCPQLPQEKIVLSIDTYRSEVARQAVLAGVDIINDISGGTFDPAIFEVVAENPYVAYVLSHIRGDINTMTQLNHYEETENLNGTEFLYNQIEKNNTQTQFIRSIGFEMSQTYRKAVQCGVKRWQIIMDPGLGFAKNGNQNIQLMKDIPLLKNYSFFNEDTKEFTNFKNIPVLVGPSRKKFIGTITKEEDASKRDFATGSVVTSCIGLGCDIVRVHNVADCSKAVKIADSIYKYL
ncbi:trifunctional dihydropteroate synthetase/dihydrohydroxymethylpterin pyrophosphokinase/dihydroneopterin aldolase FOL1 PWA37_003231 [Arxiozyma heterogenica]|uniref:Folic acid synthesis protein fol1 n=1 Tax=Arxiozyma heterogenica TaxID=278026 RepID=A0AAN7W3U4_9SACH|nr:hypothetical protein RI543_001713 [Kazachstania heterogenica]